jgi:signal transduction histidine kinase
MSLDPNQVTQALLNLMLNAVNALEDGGLIEIQARPFQDGEGVTIHVEDDGPGVPPDLQDKIFDPFYTTRERGTGLGLAMVRKIAENHHGGVSLTSPPPDKAGGTRFSLYLKSVETVPPMPP